MLYPEVRMIAAVGESLIDIAQDRSFIGGCPFNTASAASRLGAAVSFFGRISSDEYGHRIMERMIDDGVIFDPQLCNSPYPTLCSKAVIDGAGNVTYEFDYRKTAACEFTVDELSRSFSNEGDIDIVFLGSISLLMEPGCRAIVPAIGSIDTKPELFLDPNVRPALVKDPSSYRKMILDLVRRCSIVRVSEDDIRFLFPDLSVGDAEKALLGMCPANLIITRGDRGSSWFTKAFRIDCPPYKVEKVADTIGCGDTFNGAVLAYLQEHGLVRSLDALDRAAVSDMLSFASKASGLNCLADGCEPPLRSAVDKL